MWRDAYTLKLKAVVHISVLKHEFMQVKLMKGNIFTGVLSQFQ